MAIPLLVEFLATYVECLIVLLSTITASGQRYYGKVNAAITIGCSLIPAFVVHQFNQWKVFSYLTPLTSIAIVIFVTSKILSYGPLLIRSSSCILSVLLIQCIDYILVILFGHATGSSENFFHVFVPSAGTHRTAFLFVDKSIDVGLFLVLRKQLPRISKLTHHLQVYLFLITVVSYVVMQCLFQTVLVPDLSIMQLAVVASWCFLIGAIIAFIAFFLALTKQEQDGQRLEMLRSENELMADNYKTLHSTQQEYAQTLHDFKHHVMTVHELISDGKTKSALEYMDSLLKTSYSQTAQCHSGNDIVDAIINSKLAEAQVKKIQFTYMANLHIPIQIDPVDLCGVLANQLENAFEACMQTSDPSERAVHAEIKQVQSFVILRVENTVLSDPFTDNPDLHSTKQNSSTPHGYGLLNIRSIAQKYEGTLRMEFSNDRFVSVVSLCDLPFNTNNSTVG